MTKRWKLGGPPPSLTLPLKGGGDRPVPPSLKGGGDRLGTLSRFVIAFLATTVALVGCGAPIQPGGSSSAVQQASGPKTLRMAMHTSNEPVGSVATWGAPTSVSSNDMNFVYHAGLTTTLPSEQTVPWLAQK